MVSEAEQKLEIYHESAPHYACSEVTGPNVGPYEAMQEALRLEEKSGVEGWMIRDLRSLPIREYPAFGCRRRDTALADPAAQS